MNWGRRALKIPFCCTQEYHGATRCTRMNLTSKKYLGLSALAGGVAAVALVLALSHTTEQLQPSSQLRALAPSSNETIDSATLPLQTAIAAIEQPMLRADLEKLYAASEYRPLWTRDRTGRKRLDAVDDLGHSLLAQGLSAAFLATPRTGLISADTNEARAKAELQMSAAVLRAAHGQRFGFISSKTLGWNLAADEADLAGSLGEAAAENNLAEYFETLTPRHPQFKALKDGLVRYRQIAASGGWEPVPGDKPIELSGDTRLPALKARLAAEGYMSAAADDSALLEAVKVFQKRNGLGTDGRIGKGTLAALNVPVEDRIDQIAANLERWRHMRHAEPEAYVVANIADQSVAVIRDGREDLRLRTVVGTRRHATPMLEATVTAVTMNPPWVIPISIITNEILPKLNKDPNYLIENDMEVVSGNWENPRSLRVRQRPGAGNALGHMKFQMQNRWNIYLHDTPSRAFFAKDDRHLSHGCIRVDQPHELAINLLKDTSVEDINAAIASGETRTVKLEKPLPVFVLYWSVFADKNGDINFRRDFYERDSQTANALAGVGLLERPAEVAQNGN